MPNWLARGAKMARGVSQVRPPSVVRENMVSLRIDRGKPWIECSSRLSLGKRLRSQMAYTYRESNGSAVIEFLSLNWNRLSCSIRVIGALQCRPPSTDLFTSSAESLPAEVASVKKYAE